jgi:hypothetical protein
LEIGKFLGAFVGTLQYRYLFGIVPAPCALARETAGAASTRSSPAPSVLEEGKLPASLGQIVPRDRKVLFAF